MELFQLLYAVTLADCRNFSRAAEKLYITQPTLSQQIKKLEKECGFSLFLRDSKKVVLSEKGAPFIEKARLVLKEFGELQDMIREENDQLASNIFFGISVASRSYVMDCTTKLFAKFPNVSFHLVETWGPELISAVQEGNVDMAIVDLDDPTDWAGLEVTSIAKEYLCLVVNWQHPLAGRETVSIQDLENETMIFSSSKKSGISHLVMRVFEENGLHLNPGMELNSTETCATLVLNGMGVTIATNVRAEWYGSYHLSVVPIVPHIYRTYALISSSKRTERPVLKCIRAFLEEELKAGSLGIH